MFLGCIVVYIRELSFIIVVFLGILYCLGLFVLFLYYSSNKVLYDLLMRYVIDLFIVWLLRDRNSWKEIVIIIINFFSLYFIKIFIYKCII